MIDGTFLVLINFKSSNEYNHQSIWNVFALLLNKYSPTIVCFSNLVNRDNIDCIMLLTDFVQLFFHKTGAAQPEYTITADDCDSMVAIECVPMDERGRRVSADVLFVLNDCLESARWESPWYTGSKSCASLFVICRVTLSQSWQMTATGLHKVGDLHCISSQLYSLAKDFHIYLWKRETNQYIPNISTLAGAYRSARYCREKV